MSLFEVEPDFYEEDYEDEEVVQEQQQTEFDDVETEDLFVAVCRVFDEIKKYIQDQDLPILNKPTTVSNLYQLVQTK